MTARTLHWFEDDDRRDFARWSTAAAIVVFAHATLIGGYLLWHPAQQEVGDETSAVAIEVTIAEAEQQEQPKVEEQPPPPPQVTTADAIPEEKPPEKVVPPEPSPRTTAKVEAQAPRVDTSWQTLLVKQLERFKTYPGAARDRGEQGVVELAFTVDRNGHVLSRHVIASSGHPDLDAEALAVVERAQPLPAFPAGMSQSQLDVNWKLRFSLRR
jgi:periplasmic protein TonB